MAAGTAAILGGGALLGGLAGSGGGESTTTRNVAPATQAERDQQTNSLNAYLAQQNLVNQQQNQLSSDGSAFGLQNNSINSINSVLNGDAFNINPQQQAQIDNIRNASIQAGQGDIQDYLDSNLSKISNSAGVRGLRGQAVSQLQGDALGASAKQYGNLVNQANLTAANQALAVPYQQASLQANTANSNSNYANNIQQQAINNQQMLQNPTLLNYYQNERLGAAGQTTSTPGSLGSVLGGALGGAGAAAGGIGAYNGGIKKYDGGRISDKKWTVDDKHDFEKGFNSGGESPLDSLRRLFSGEDDSKNKMYNGGFVSPIRQQTSAFMANGGRAPGRAMLPGNHPMNDVINVEMSPEEIVIPNSHSHDQDLAVAFIKHLFKKEKKGA